MNAVVMPRVKRARHTQEADFANDFDAFSDAQETISLNSEEGNKKREDLDLDAHEPVQFSEDEDEDEDQVHNDDDGDGDGRRHDVMLCVVWY